MSSPGNLLLVCPPEMKTSESSPLVQDQRKRSAWQNGHAESFVSRLRAEMLDVEAFLNLADAQVKLAVYRRYYNEQRPHSSLGYRPPAEAMSSSKGDYS